MTQAPNAPRATQRFLSGTRRLYRAYRVLPYERRLAALAALGLFVTLFLPWYQRQFFTVVGGKPVPASDTLTAWGAFSFVEAAVLLVAAGVLTLLFQRAEGRAFHLPGGDGGVITAAGAWTCVLVVWRIFDKQGGQASGQNVVTNGIEWGIFVTLGVAVFLTYVGSRIRAAHRPEPPLPGEGPSRAGGEDRQPGQAERQPPSPARRSPRSGRPEPASPPEPDALIMARELRHTSRAEPNNDRKVGSPRPVSAEDAVTVKLSDDDPPTEEAPTKVSRRPKRGPDDDQLTIPLDD
jgi:hypothetical protein